MTIKEKIEMNRQDLEANGAINIVAFGDSITHGGFAIGEVNQEAVYHNLLKKKLNSYRSFVPVNVINSGIGGQTAEAALLRFGRDVEIYNPDLVIICFGLNDVNLPLKNYINALKTIFKKCKDNSFYTIFMTPNMLNTYVADDTPAEFIKYAEKTAEIQNNGTMDLYMQSACQVAQDMDIIVCDCYSRWKEMHNRGKDVTMLLANRINHPVKEMHNLFADELYKIIMGNADQPNSCDHTMYIK